MVHNFVKEVTADQLREHLDYDPGTGIFRWKKAPRFSRGVVLGNIAGAPVKHGYVRICLLGKQYLSHRLAWLHVHGKWPVDQLDHIDGDPSNNSINNLRECTTSENMRNRHARGYDFDKRYGTYRAYINAGAGSIHLGCFNSEQEARAAYETARDKYFGQFSVSRSRKGDAHAA